MAEDRDKQSMGESRSLAPSRAVVTYSYGGAPGNAWFGPLEPMSPMAPPSTKGRILDYPVGYNQSVRPRAYEAITFAQLRNFADGFDLLRIVIETRKDQMARLKWSIAVKERHKDKAEALAERILEIEEFFERPNKEDFWQEWLRMILEDLFVIDAPAIHRRRTYGEELYALDPLDGGTIKRVIDQHARTPEDGPAYQQVLHGMPAVDYDRTELLYRPRNKRTHKIYGYSPVEQIIMTINIALRRQIWQLASFTEGNIPEALIGVPPNWTPDQIEQFQGWFDAMLEGNTAQRRKAKFVPGDVAKSFFATKPDKLFDKETEEWLARVVCFAFSISPQPFIQMMNRATAESAQETAMQDGLAPIMNWVKSLVDTVLIEDFENPELEFVWIEEDELDPKVQSDILEQDSASGRITINEARQAQGKDPYPEPDFDRPMVKTSSGWVPIVLTPEEKAEKAAQAALAAAAAGPGGPPKPGAPGADPAAASDEGIGLNADEEIEGAGTADEEVAAAETADDEVAASESADDEVGVKPKEGAEKSDRPFHDHALCGAKGRNLGKNDSDLPSYVDPEREEAQEHLKSFREKMEAALASLGQSVADQVEARLKELGKADDDGIDIDDLLNGLSVIFGDDFAGELFEDMAPMFASSGKLALAQIGSTSSELVNQVSDRSVEWAESAAAELVTNISDATRDMLRGTITSGMEENLSAEDIAASIKDSYAFSDDRSSLIAMTEIATANSQGALAGYKEAEDAGVKVKKSWLILDDACDVCQENADAGAIPLDEDFPSGDDATPGHPNCRCVIVPEVEDAEVDPA